MQPAGNAARVNRSARSILGWALSALVLVIYALLPNGHSGGGLDGERARRQTEPPTLELDIVDVSPASLPAGRAITITYEGTAVPESVDAFAGKRKLEVLSRNSGSIVAQLPSDLEPGRVKIRVASPHDRSKPYDLQIEPRNWQKPFRKLVGGFALMVLGIVVFARGARHAIGLQMARALTRWTHRTPASVLTGFVSGALVQSTTAAAALIAGLFSSSLLALAPAAAAFLGAQVGAATAPIVVGVIEPEEALLVVALGTIWTILSIDRRSTALGRLLLGAGLIAFGVQTLRPGFDVLTTNPELLSLLAGLNADTVRGAFACGLVGAVLVAALQGPALALLLVLALAQTTAQWDLRTALAVLSGTGLGAALGALITTPAGERGRRLALLHLLLGAASTLLALLTLDLWIYVADALVSGSPDEVRWGKRVLLPNMGWHLGVGFAASQLGVVLVLQLAVPGLARLLTLRLASRASLPPARIGDATRVVRSSLLDAAAGERRALDMLRQLVLRGDRDTGRGAEHLLGDLLAAQEQLLAGPVQALPRSADGDRWARAALASVELCRSLQMALKQVERFVDRRIAALDGSEAERPLPLEDAIPAEMHALLDEGMDAVLQAIRLHSVTDVEQAQDREIRLNRLAARARESILTTPADRMAGRLGVLAVVHAYEGVGNELYRLSEALAESHALTAAHG